MTQSVESANVHGATHHTHESENVVVGRDWRAEFALWSFRQGPFFVLLCAMGYGLWATGRYAMQEGIPAHLRQIQTGYREIQESHLKNLDRVEKALVDLVEAHKVDHGVMRESQKILMSIEHTLKEQLKDAKKGGAS